MVSQWKSSRRSFTPLSVEQILPPLVIRVAHQPHNVAAGMQIERVRLTHQLHTHFRRKLVPFVTVAFVAASYQVLPGRGAPSGAGNDVIECKLA